MTQYFENKLFLKKTVSTGYFFFHSGFVSYLPMNHAHANLITLIFQHHQQTEKTFSRLLLGCCSSSPSVTQSHFVCGKNGCGFHRTPRAVCWVTSWENFSCSALHMWKMKVMIWKTTLEKKNVSTEGGKKKKRRGIN